MESKKTDSNGVRFSGFFSHKLKNPKPSFHHGVSLHFSVFQSPLFPNPNLFLFFFKPKSLSPLHPLPSNPNPFTSLLKFPRAFSSNRKSKGEDQLSRSSWTFSLENDAEDPVFGSEEGNLSGIADDKSIGDDDNSWSKDSTTEKAGGYIFEEIDKEFARNGGNGEEEDEWKTAEGYKPWTLRMKGEMGPLISERM